MIIVHVFNPIYWDIWFEGTPYKTSPKVTAKAKDWCLTAEADACYNLAYFEMASGKTVNFVKAKGSDIGYGGVTERLEVSFGNVCGGYAVGIKDNDLIMRNDLTTRTRNGIGITKSGKTIIAQSDSKVTERAFCKEVGIQVATYFKDTIKLFLMEDGGASTQMYSNISKLGINPEGGRKVATVTCVKRKTPIGLKPMKAGDKGESVRYLQMILGGLVCDGSYGNATKKRVKLAQTELKKAGLYTGNIDGICGQLTIKALS